MIRLKIYEARTFYSGPDDELETMFEVLRIKDKNSKFRQRAILQRMGYLYMKKDEMSDGQIERKEKIEEATEWIKFYDARRKSFGTGLLSRVRDHLKECGIHYERDDRRSKRIEFTDSDVRYTFQDKVETREEQTEAFREALHKGSGILHLATNAGKTEIAAMIISAWKLKKGKWPRTLFLIHRKGLARQTADRFEKHLGEKVACFGGSGEKRLRRITVSTTQTAHNLVEDNSENFLDFLQKCDLVFVDELHQNKAGSVVQVLNECRARMRFGLSGTISKEPHKIMHYIGTIGPVISELRNKALVDLGRSAKPIMRMVKVETDEVDGNFGDSYRYAIVENRFRNSLVRKEAFRYVDKDLRTMITVSRIDHGRALRDRISREVDFPVEFIHGATPLYARQEIKRKFEKGKIPILIASSIMDVGEDLPAIDAWVNAAGGKGWELVLQRLGRTLRRKEGENQVRISDFLDYHNHYMMSHSIKRLEYYINEKIAKIKIA
jgi:superfamily II DNA or RNA helicase